MRTAHPQRFRLLAAGVLFLSSRITMTSSAEYVRARMEQQDYKAHRLDARELKIIWEDDGSITVDGDLFVNGDVSASGKVKGKESGKSKSDNKKNRRKFGKRRGLSTIDYEDLMARVHKIELEVYKEDKYHLVSGSVGDGRKLRPLWVERAENGAYELYDEVNGTTPITVEPGTDNAIAIKKMDGGLRIGFNTTNPGYPFHFNGDVHVTGSITADAGQCCGGGSRGRELFNENLLDLKARLDELERKVEEISNNFD